MPGCFVIEIQNKAGETATSHSEGERHECTVPEFIISYIVYYIGRLFTQIQYKAGETVTSHSEGERHECTVPEFLRSGDEDIPPERVHEHRRCIRGAG